MRHALLLVLFACPSIASAQTVATFTFAGEPAPPQASPEAVLGRVLSFDRDGDGRVSRMELSERMQPIVARGDTDADGALDAREIRRLIELPPERAGAASRPFGGTYAFADVIGISSRSHIDGAIEDLKLPVGRKEQALAVVDAFLTRHEASARAGLLADLQEVLTPAQVLDFTSAFDDHRLRLDGGRMVFEAAAPAGSRTTVIVHPGLVQRIASYRLGPAQAAANTALARFEWALRFGETERAALVAALDDALTVEERENLRAALERRPLVRTAGNIVVKKF